MMRVITQGLKRSNESGVLQNPVRTGTPVGSGVPMTPEKTEPRLGSQGKTFDGD
jgi:hypothetical protein